jgi:hypothetical protein
MMKAKQKSLKEILQGKQLTIDKALRVGNPSAVIPP